MADAAFARTQERKQVAPYWYQAGARGQDLDLYDQFLTPDVVDHSPVVQLVGAGRAAAKRLFADQFGPGVHSTSVVVEDLSAEGDTVAARLTTHLAFQGDVMGVLVAGQTATLSSIEILRCEGTMIAEHWTEQDLRGLFAQLGIIPIATTGDG